MGAGSSTAAHSYRYKDITVAPGLNYWYRLADISLDGAMHMHKAVQVTVQPAEYSLEQNYPNPFNPETRLYFQLPASEEVKLIIYNTRGQIVRHLVESRYDAGRHTINWDGRDNAGNRVPTGVYVYRIKAGDHIAARKMTLVK